MCDRCLLPFSPHFFQQFSSLTAESTNPLHPSHPAHPPHPAPPTSQFSTDGGFWAHRECKNNPTRSILSARMCAKLLQSVTLWIVAHQAPLSMGFSRQESWSGLPRPFTQGSNPHLWHLLRWWVSFITGATWGAWSPYLLPSSITSLSASVHRILLLAYFTKSISVVSLLIAVN